MKRDDHLPEATELRRRAEAVFEQKTAEWPESQQALSPEATRAQLHELRVHQIELEMQDEELRRAQIELDVSRARYFDLYDLAPVGYITVGELGLVQNANFTAAALLGVTRADLVQQPLSRFIQRDYQDSYYLLRKQLLATGVAQALDLRLVKGDSTSFWAHIEATAAEDKGATVIRIVLSDVTARKQAEREHERLEHKMQETQKLESLGVLAGGIAHDFNNLLAVILGNASLASRELPPGSPVHAYLESINEGSLRAADLCAQMLAYAGRGRFDVTRLGLSQLVEATAKMLRVSVSKKAALRFQLEENLPLVVADVSQIRQVIMNAVINASEAIGDDSGVITLATGLQRADRAYLDGALLGSDLPEGEYVFFEVSDNGSGMNAATRAKIFDPFFTTKFTGRGLGLAAVGGIVRGHKGAMKVVSEPGGGTTFRFLFPAQSGSDKTAADDSSAVGPWQGQGTVLVVDDEESVRATAALMLTVAGFDPILVGDGREALEIFRADPNRFELVLLDLTMPHMGGAETLAAMQKLRADVRVVLMSGYNEQDALVQFTGRDPAGFLKKPFTIDDLRLATQVAVG